MLETSIWEKRFYEKTNNAEFKRDDYGRDRARIIHSAFFRRLQGKTQVLGLGESDFYRTRLTHSLEVAQIANGITESVKNQAKINESFIQLLPHQNLIESIGLAHDIGHPPFGHGGEVALNYVMKNHGGFEGNAQTLRICTTLGEYTDNNGLNLTRRTLLGIIKYPCFYSSVVNEKAYKKGNNSTNLDSYKPPKCIFDSDQKFVDWILQPFSDKDKKIFMSMGEEVGDKHKKAKYKSFDSSIMEIADDIAYGVHDLEDAVALGLVSERQWKEEVVDKLSDELKEFPLASKMRDYTSWLFSGENKTRKKAISALVHYFITNVEAQSLGIFEHNLLDYQATLNPLAKEELDVLQKFIVTNVIKTPEVQTLEYKGQQMIVRLFETINDNPSRLLPKKYHERYEIEDNKLRVVCDYIAGTTDDYATRLYHKIFTPSSGSIFDKL